MHPNFVPVDDRFGLAVVHKIGRILFETLFVESFRHLGLIPIQVVRPIRRLLKRVELLLRIVTLLAACVYQSFLRVTNATNDRPPTAIAKPSIMNLAPPSWLTPSPGPLENRVKPPSTIRTPIPTVLHAALSWAALLERLRPG